MKKKYTLYFLIIFFLFSIPLRIDAVVAYPFPVEFKQPNGEIIIIQAHGDENFHYMTTEDGYLIDFDSNSGYFFYASIIDGRIVPGPAKVSAMKLKSTFGLLRSDSNEFLEKVKRPALTRIFEARMKGLQNSTIDLRSSTVIIGDRKALVILVNFKNVIFSVNNPHRSFDRMLNQVGYSENGGTGSARDFYIDNSNGQFTPDFNVYGPVDLPQNMEYYGENDANGNDKNAEQMIVDACQAAKTKYGATLNFADYDYDKDGKVDNIFVFYAGYNEAENSTTKPNTVWPHKSSVESKNVKIDGVLLTNYACTSELKESSGVKMAGIGTFTHEFGHVLGLPDFYDADGDANGNGVGLGYWSTMDKGNYLNGGNTPPYFSAIERYLLGWITLTEITATTNPQTKSLNPIKQSSTNQAFRLNTSTAEEFFVFESRQAMPGTWDAFLKGEGMLVYHVDRTTTRNKSVEVNGQTYPASSRDLWDIQWPNIIGNHQCMDMLRANNVVGGYSGNPYPGSDIVNSISDYTTPGFLSWNNSRTYVKIENISRNASTGVVSFSIQKNETSPYPYVQTEKINHITQTAATLHGSLLESGPSPVTEKGFCWSKSSNPSLSDNVTKASGTALGAYTVDLSNLQLNTTYYVKAYVRTANQSVYYGSEVSFATLPAAKSLPFVEDFKNGIVEDGWTAIDKNVDGQTWYSTFLTDDKENPIYVSGIDVTAGTANDWLISPQLIIPSSLGDVFFNFRVAITSTQSLDVLISDSYKEEGSFEKIGTLNYSYPAGATGIQGFFELSPAALLNEYKGKSIFIAFSNTTPATSDGVMYLTNITLTTQFDTGVDDINTTTHLPVVYTVGKSIYFKDIFESYEAEVYDLTGKLHYRWTVSEDTNYAVNEKGIYLVKLKSSKQVFSYKLIIR